MGTDKVRAAIAAVIATFPATFELRAWPGETFRLNADDSFFTGGFGSTAGPLMLYVERRIGDDWASWTKGTPDELRAQILGRAYRQVAT